VHHTTLTFVQQRSPPLDFPGSNGGWVQLVGLNYGKISTEVFERTQNDYGPLVGYSTENRKVCKGDVAG